MGEQRTPLFDILNTIVKMPHPLLKRISIRKRNKRERQRERQRVQEDLVSIIEQLIENEALMKTIKQSEGKISKRLAIKTLKKSKKKKKYEDINLAAKTQRKLLRENYDSTPEKPRKSMGSVQENKPAINAQLPPLNPTKENGIPIITPNNSLENNLKINNEKLLRPLLKTVQNKPPMKTEGLIIPAKKAIENKSSIEKNKTSNQKNEKNVQSQSTTNTKPSKKERPEKLLKKSEKKNSNFISFNPLNEVQDIDQYINSIIDDL
jgi:hypothetical protein